MVEQLDLIRTVAEALRQDYDSEHDAGHLRWQDFAGQAERLINLVAARPYDSVHGIEQSRRDFMRDYPELHRYISLREQAKALDSAGDRISCYMAAANVVWTEAFRLQRAWRAMAGV